MGVNGRGLGRGKGIGMGINLEQDEEQRPGYNEPATCRCDLLAARQQWKKLRRRERQTIISELRKTMAICEIAQLLSVKPQVLYDCIR